MAPLTYGRAESPPPFKDFSAKRVKAPEKGARPKIDVQIGEPSQGTPQGISEKRQGKSLIEEQYPWFWEKVSPALTDIEAGRLEAALQHIVEAPGGRQVDVMRLQALQDIATTYKADILAATVGTEVSPALVLAVIAVESSGDHQAISAAGARGLMQLMPETIDRFDVTDPLVASENIRGGVAFLDLLMERFAGDPVFVLAGYNAGENAVLNAQGVPNYVETRDYVPKVLATYASARGLCMTPPELLSDGCVFITR